MAEPNDGGKLNRQAERAAEPTLRPQERALEMRSVGFTYRQIADALGIALSTAHTYVKNEMVLQRQELAESREDVRDLDMQKLAWLERRLMQAANEGDLQAGRMLLGSIQLRRLYMKDLPPKQTRRDEMADLDAYLFGRMPNSGEAS